MFKCLTYIYIAYHHFFTHKRVFTIYCAFWLEYNEIALRTKTRRIGLVKVKVVFSMLSLVGTMLIFTEN